MTELEENSEGEKPDESDPWSDSEDYDTDLDIDTTVTEMFQGEKKWNQNYSGLFVLLCPSGLRVLLFP